MSSEQEIKKRIAELESELKEQRSLLKSTRRASSVVCGHCKEKFPIGNTALVELFSYHDEAYSERWETAGYAFVCPNCETPNLLSCEKSDYEFPSLFPLTVKLCMNQDWSRLPTPREWNEARDELRKKGYLKKAEKCECDCCKSNRK